MKINNFRKSMIISLICILILPSIAVATTENNSNYNLKIKIKNTKFFYNTSTNYRLSINVSNEGPDFSDNYSVRVVTYRLFSRNSWPWFRLMTDFSYTGSTIEPGSYEKKMVYCTNAGNGWYLARASVNSNDNNPKGNVSYCFIWVQFR